MPVIGWIFVAIVALIATGVRLAMASIKARSALDDLDIKDGAIALLKTIENDSKIDQCTALAIAEDDGDLPGWTTTAHLEDPNLLRQALRMDPVEYRN